MAVSEIVESPADVCSFAVFPDGSKEGWPESNEGDTKREMFRAYLNRQRWRDGSSPLDWAEVQYGDDEGDNKVVAHEAEVEVSDDYKGPADLE